MFDLPRKLKQTAPQIGNSIKDFKNVKEIGSGNYATVYRAECIREGFKGRKVAIKKISWKNVKKKKLEHRVKSEISIHCYTRHHSIAELYNWFEDEVYIYLVMELCAGGTLEGYLQENRYMNEKDASYVIWQVISALQFVHSQNVLHRDLSLRNILFTEGLKIKIIDFGMAASLKEKKDCRNTILGTANFIAPEVWLKQPYSYKADCWSVGCILWALLFGKPPFYSKQDTISGYISYPKKISYQASKLLQALLNRDPEFRIDMNDAILYDFVKEHELNQAEINQHPKQRSIDSGMGFSSNSRSAQKDKNSNERVFDSLDSSSNRCRQSASLDRYKSSNSNNKLSGYHSGSFKSLPKQETETNVKITKTRSRSSSRNGKRSESQVQMGCCTSIESYIEFPAELLQRVSSGNPIRLTNPTDSSKTDCGNVCRASNKQQLQHVKNSGSSSSHLQMESSHKKKGKQLTHSKYQKEVQKGLKDVMEPLYTLRLIPQRKKQPYIFATILDGGEVFLEFLNEKKSFICDSMCLISGDGLMIKLYTPENPYVPSSEVPDLESNVQKTEKFTYENLPQKHWKKYWYGKTFVDYVRCNTLKVKCRGNNGICEMYENTPQPNFLAKFYNGGANSCV